MPGLRIALLTIFIICLLCFIKFSRSKTISEYMVGAWIANDSFCDQAEVETLMIVFAEPTAGYFGKTEQLGHIIATPDMINTGFKLRYRRGVSLSAYKYKFDATIEFDDGPLWDENITITIDVLEGRMKIFSGETLYADMFKSHDITDTIKDIEVIDE